MTAQANNSDKFNPFTLSNQVKSILHKKGLSKVFNYSDFNHFKLKTINAFNRAQSIAELFAEEYQEQSDLKEYIF